MKVNSNCSVKVNIKFEKYIASQIIKYHFKQKLLQKQKGFLVENKFKLLYDWLKQNKKKRLTSKC